MRVQMSWVADLGISNFVVVVLQRWRRGNAAQRTGDHFLTGLQTSDFRPQKGRGVSSGKEVVPNRSKSIVRRQLFDLPAN